MNHLPKISIGTAVAVLNLCFIHRQYTNIQNLTKETVQLKEKVMSPSPPRKLKEDISGKTVLSVSKSVSTAWDTDAVNVYENEKKWLTVMKSTGIVAKPIHFDDKTRTVTTEYVGEKVNKRNLPDNWEQQRDFIICQLKTHNCRHNDIKPDELIVHDGKIKLIDFGWAHELNKKNPDSWPTCLGGEFKCNQPDRDHDDLCSFNKSIQHILGSGSTR